MLQSPDLSRPAAVATDNAGDHARVKKWLESESIRENLRKLHTQSAVQFITWGEGAHIWNRVWLPSLPCDTSDDEWTREFIDLNDSSICLWDDETRAELQRNISKLLSFEAEAQSGTKRSSLPGNPGNRKRPHEELRDYLIKTIESTIGRSIERRSSKPIDPRLSDPASPNSYAWIFSPKYPSFPPSPIGRWTAEQQKWCKNALKDGHLKVVTIDSSNAELVDLDQSLMAAQGLTSHSPDGTQHAMATSQKHDAVPRSPSSPMLQPAAPVADNLDCLFSNLQAHITAKIRCQTNMKEQAEAKALHLEKKTIVLQQQIHEMSRSMEQERVDLAQQVEDQSRKFEAQLEEKASKARERAIDDLAIMRRAMYLSHLEQLDKARDEAYNKGLAERFIIHEQLEATPQANLSKQAHADEVQRLQRQLQLLRDEHAKSVSRIREEARKEGREMAFRELSINPEDGMSNLIGGQNELNTSRKIRELKTIFQNWHQIPQRALPSYMLPEGHIPGDKNLYLLAKLSKEVDAKTAGQLLRAEIDVRQKHILENARSLIVQNADIKQVLKSLSTASATEAQDTIVAAKVSTAGEQGHEPLLPVKPVVLQQPTSRAKAPKVSPSLHTGKPLPNSTGSMGGPLAMRTISKNSADVTNLLSAPITADLPNDLQTFSPAFIREYIGGNETTFSRVGSSMREKQIVAWPEILRINPDHHEFAPELGSHGALTLVDGRTPCGLIGDTYPTMLKKSKETFEYIGHYMLACRVIVGPSEWRLWSIPRRMAIAKEIAESTWGAALLAAAGLQTQKFTLDDRIDEILGFFELEKRPYLRMNWTVLQYDHFDYKHYETLVSKVRDQSHSELAESASGPNTIIEAAQTTRKRQNPSNSRAKDEKRLKLDTVHLNSAEAAIHTPKAERSIMDFGDLYNATPEPRHCTNANSSSLLDPDLPRLGDNPSMSHPGKKELSSKEAGIAILKNLGLDSIGAPNAQAKDREAGYPEDWPTWDAVNKITAISPRPPCQYSIHDPHPTLAEINKFLKMLSFSKDRPENDWQLYLWPVGEEQLLPLGRPEKVVSLAQWHQRTGHSRNTEKSSFATLFSSQQQKDGVYSNSRSNVWVATIRPYTQHEKELIIWSPWARAKYLKKAPDGTTFHEARDLPGAQKTLIDFLHHHNEPLSRIWFGTPRERCDWFQAGNWLLDTFDGPKAKLPQTYGEFRAAGYVEVKLPPELWVAS